jgi:hypothetical protein
MSPRRIVLIAYAMVMAAVGFGAAGQPPGRGRGGPPPPAREGAPIDLTGYWVSVVTEDWRHRMMTPQKGDYESVPLNAAGRRLADGWDPARDDASGNACRAFGVGNIIRQPGRLRITWDDANTLKLEFDAGTQTRLLRFEPAARPAGPRTWQGFSRATWLRPARASVDRNDPRVSDTVGTVPGGGGSGLRGGPPLSRSLVEGGSLEVETTNVRAGYLRSNGVPYSENARVTEHFDLLPPYANGDLWLIVSTTIEDPTYLTQPFHLSTQFKKERDGSKWNPTPCRTDPPAPVAAR